VFVPGSSGGLVSAAGSPPASSFASPSWENPLAADLVWVATDDRRILLYGAVEPERGREVGRIVLAAEAASILYHASQVWVGLGCGSLSVYRRDPRYRMARADVCFYPSLLAVSSIRICTIFLIWFRIREQLELRFNYFAHTLYLRTV
jgi:hypothetical protein